MKSLLKIENKEVKKIIFGKIEDKIQKIEWRFIEHNDLLIKQV